MMAPVVSAVDSSIKGIIAGPTTLAKAMHNIFQSILLEIVNNFIKKIVTEWIAGEAAKLAASNGAFASMLTMMGFQKAATIGAKKTEAVAVIPSEAAIAAGGAAASVASIPYVGPALAAAAYAETFAMVMGGLAATAGFAVGSWNVPQDMFTKVHAGETILNANDAENFRNASGGGGTIYINSQGGDWINKKDLAKLLKQMKRDFVEV